jgi:protein-S-isoprenylcysteine O-methyltransferase Ste14
MAAWQHLRAILLLPFMATVVVPATLLYLAGPDTFGVWQSAPAAGIVLAVGGVLLIGLGLVLVVATVRLFATVGQGTLAPWDPPQRLVVRGVYRRVRNPMISGVGFILFGEAVATASLPLLCWFAFFAVVNAVYIPLAEEPGLARRFGEEYEAYRRNVTRWIPRLRAWEGGDDIRGPGEPRGEERPA